MSESSQIGSQGLIDLLRKNIETLNPAYFAMVMATGIVSVAAHLLGLRVIAIALLWINPVALLILVSLTAVRLIFFPRQVLADLTDHKRGVGFFTVVPALCVLGSQLLLISDFRSAAVGLWVVGAALWFVLNYTIFTCFTVKLGKPSLTEGIHGGWLVSVVATQSVVVLGGMLAASLESYRESALFCLLAMWLSGGMLYVMIISLIFYRYSFFPMSPAELTPPYWINMGAMAISTLAGTTLLAAAEESAILSQLLPFIKGVTLLCWSTATWWIPMLLILGVWRHIVKRFRIVYDPQYWGAVFPIGMYTVCTFRLSHAMDVEFLASIPRYFIYIAVAAWLLTFLAMLRSWINTLLQSQDPLLQNP